MADAKIMAAALLAMHELSAKNQHKAVRLPLPRQAHLCGVCPNGELLSWKIVEPDHAHAAFFRCCKDALQPFRLHVDRLGI